MLFSFCNLHLNEILVQMYFMETLKKNLMYKQHDFFNKQHKFAIKRYFIVLSLKIGLFMLNNRKFLQYKENY